MDERVDRSDPRIAPDPVSRATPVPSRSRTGYWILTGLIATGLAGGGWYSLDPAPDPHRRRRAPRRDAAHKALPQPVGFATIDKGDIRIILNELGTVTSLDTVTVQTQINGQLSGDRLQGRPGGQEGRLPGADRSAALPAQRSSRRRARWRTTRACWQQAQTDLKRYQTLGRQDSIAQQQLDDQRFLVQQYTGTVQTDQGAVDAAKLNLAYCHIVSPIDGQVGLRLVDHGNYVQTASTTGIGRDHPDAAHFGDLRGARGQPAGHHPAAARRRDADRRGLRPLQHQTAGDRALGDTGQPDRAPPPARSSCGRCSRTPTRCCTRTSS